MYIEKDLEGWSQPGHKFYYLYKSCSHRFDVCNNPKNPRYKDYGGRGIQVKFKNKVEMGLAILNSIGFRLSDNLTIDRINNDGHYEVGNWRWALSVEQSLNQRRTKHPYIQFYIDRINSNPYKVMIKELGNNFHTLFCKRFKTLEQAIEARDLFLIQTNDPRYFTIYPKVA